VKRLRLLGDKTKQRAEVAASFARFEEAENLYRAADRMDLAVELRMRTGEWGRVLELLEAPGGGGAGDDELLKLTRDRLGDFYADRGQWTKAIPLYQSTGNAEALCEAYYIVEDYEGLVSLAETLPAGNPVLKNLGQKLASVGITEGSAKVSFELVC